MNCLSTDKLLDYLDCAVICLDRQQQVDYINSSAESLLEISFASVQNHKLTRIFNHKHSKSLFTSLQACIETGQSITEREIRIKLYNGHSVIIDYTINPVRETESGLHAIMELRAVDRHLRIAREEQLHSQQLASQQLARGLAHEIKNPLGGIRGAAQLLQREALEEEWKEYTQIIIRETDRLQTLINKMLGPNRSMVKSRVNIFEVLEHVRSLLLAEAPDSYEIKREYDPSIPELHADRDQLIQAFLNIARNAAQAAGDHGNIIFRTEIARHYTINQVTHRLAVRVQIIDDGPGIETDIQANIFLPMVTNKTGGTGLGLPIAQQIIQSHGGLIKCLSQPGNTNFTTILPLETEHAH